METGCWYNRITKEKITTTRHCQANIDTKRKNLILKLSNKPISRPIPSSNNGSHQLEVTTGSEAWNSKVSPKEPKEPPTKWPATKKHSLKASTLSKSPKKRLSLSPKKERSPRRSLRKALPRKALPRKASLKVPSAKVSSVMLPEWKKKILAGLKTMNPRKSKPLLATSGMVAWSDNFSMEITRKPCACLSC